MSAELEQRLFNFQEKLKKLKLQIKKYSKKKRMFEKFSKLKI